MRIDLVITELFPGGAERCLTRLALGLAESGDQVRVFSIASLPQGEQRLLVDELDSAGISVSSADANNATSLFAASRRLRRWFAESKADVCQTFLYHANVLGTWAAKREGIAVRVGGLRVAEPRPIRCWIESQALKRMSSLVCVSQATRSFAIEKLNCPTSKALVISNSVDATRFSTATPKAWSQLSWPDDAQVSLFVGRLHHQKGIDLLQSQIDGFAATGTKRRLLLIGEGPMHRDLQSWANTVGADRVQILPWQKEIASFIRGSTLLVLPSRYEGMPNVVMEAMAAGKPVVCSNAEGSEELLKHEMKTQVFRIGDGVAMKKLVEQFLSNESLCELVGRRNQQRARADFSVPAMIDAYRSHYRQLTTSLP
jgi:glycosyltransferase involved in cell wall biosynthesis